MLRKLVNSRYFLWLLLAIPGLAMTAGYASGRMVYGEYLHATGEFSARMLIAALAVTPLRLAWPRAGWTRWLVQRRRYLGVAMFAYAVPHLVAYVLKLASANRVWEEAAEPGMWTGWLALVIALVLALTSNNASVKRLGRRWKTLHRLVYLAALLTFAHWVLVAFDPVPGYIHLALLALLESYRLWKTRRSNPR